MLAILVAYIIVGVLAFYSGRQNERRTYEPHQHGISAANAAQERCAGRESAAMAECIIEEVSAAEDTARNEQDLEAQQQMALWALLMVLVSAATVGVTVWALVYVKGTLDETKRMSDITRDMAKEATEATRAMGRQNALTEQAHRPWLSVQIVRLENIGWAEDGRFRCDYSLAATNSGNAPALIVSEFVGIEPIEDGKFSEQKFIEHARELLAVRAGAVAPGGAEVFTANRSLISTKDVPLNGRYGNGSIHCSFVAGVMYQSPRGDRIHSTVLRLTIVGNVLDKGRDPSETIAVHVNKTHMS